MRVQDMRASPDEPVAAPTIRNLTGAALQRPCAIPFDLATRHNRR